MIPALSKKNCAITVDDFICFPKECYKRNIELDGDHTCGEISDMAKAANGEVEIHGGVASAYTFPSITCI